jgi:hypothetical protein
MDKKVLSLRSKHPQEGNCARKKTRCKAKQDLIDRLHAAQLLTTMVSGARPLTVEMQTGTRISHPLN